MFAQMTSALDFHAKALVLRAERQRVIASNIANVDTPGYTARELNFREAMASVDERDKQAGASHLRTNSSSTDSRHIPLAPQSGELGGARRLAYGAQAQPSLDRNSVDLDRERSSFVDNAVHYESTLRFINGHAKTILSAIQGQ